MPLQVDLRKVEPAPEAAAIVEKLRQQKKGKSSIIANVLLFVGVLLVFVVFMREWNQGRPKEATMFGGGGPSESSEEAAPASGPALRGRVRLGQGIEVADRGTLFVMVRMAGTPDRGPPVAVKKIDAPMMPVQFEIGPADVMMKGMPFNGPFDVYARLDRDGDPMTRDPDDLVVGAPLTGARPGGDPVEIVLDRRVRELPAPGEAAPVVPSPAAPVAAAQPSAPPAAVAGDRVGGTIKLDPSLGAAAGGTIFIVLRAAGSADRGPPIAVKKIDRPAFPQQFSVGAEDVMLEGMPFTGPFDLYVRLDADGNAMTREPGDLELSAPKTNVKPGDRSLEIALDKRR